MKLQIRSDRTAVDFNCTSPLLKTMIRMKEEDTLCYCTVFFSSLLLHIASYQLTSLYYRISTTRTIDFLPTDFTDSNGVSTSTSCFCLNYHNFHRLHLRPFHFQGTVDNNNLIFPLLFESVNQASAKKFFKRLSITTNCKRICTLRKISLKFLCIFFDMPNVRWQIWNSILTRCIWINSSRAPI